MPVFTRIVLRTGPLSLLLVLILSARSPYSHNPSGALQLFLFSLFVSLGFLLFGGQRFEVAGERCRTSA